MNTGQMMLTIAALLLLSIIVLRVNNSFLSTNTAVNQTKYEVMAVSLGTSIIEQATDKAFDAATIGASVTNLNSLTSPGSLGPETGDAYPDFDDFDDFNGYTKNTASDATFLSANFTATTVVDYVTPDAPNTNANQRTWHKRLRVTVTSPSMPDTVRLSTIFSYFYFR